jgi:actin cytoskeleton-regulatory complex protein SLA1
MSDEHEEYIAVLKASYDYVPQSEDEIEIKEDQLLLLVEKTDDECVHPLCSSGTSLTFHSWWKAKPMGVSDVQGGLVPSAYVDSVSARWTTATWTCRGMRAK